MRSGSSPRPQHRAALVGFVVAALCGFACGDAAGPKSAGSAGGPGLEMEDLHHVKAGMEGTFTDLGDIEGFEKLSPRLQALVVARANRVACNCGCIDHSVNHCLHQREDCDVAQRLASGFVDDALAVQLLGGHPDDAIAGGEPGRTPPVEAAPPAEEGAAPPETTDVGAPAPIPVRQGPEDVSIETSFTAEPVVPEVAPASAPGAPPEPPPTVTEPGGILPPLGERRIVGPPQLKPPAMNVGGIAPGGVTVAPAAVAPPTGTGVPAAPVSPTSPTGGVSPLSPQAAPQVTPPGTGPSPATSRISPTAPTGGVTPVAPQVTPPPPPAPPAPQPPPRQ